MAESPPPTTAISLSRKKKPSHVAHADTPRPRSRCSLSMLSHRAEAPVARITDWPSNAAPRAQTRNGRPDRSTLSTSRSKKRVPKRSAWARNFAIRSGPSMPSGKPG